MYIFGNFTFSLCVLLTKFGPNFGPLFPTQQIQIYKNFHTNKSLRNNIPSLITSSIPDVPSFLFLSYYMSFIWSLVAYKYIYRYLFLRPL